MIREAINAWKLTKTIHAGVKKSVTLAKDLLERLKKLDRKAKKEEPRTAPINRELGDLFKNGSRPKASELEEYALSQGWKRTQTTGGPAKYIDDNGIERRAILGLRVAKHHTWHFATLPEIGSILSETKLRINLPEIGHSSNGIRNMDYIHITNLNWVYLEDSYVMDIVEYPGSFIFKIDAVLTPKDPLYHPPRQGEQHCYAKGCLVFKHATKVEWVRDTRRIARTVDPSGEVDFGNIDILTKDDGVYTAEGTWGRVLIHSGSEPLFAHADKISGSID